MGMLGIVYDWAGEKEKEGIGKGKEQGKQKGKVRDGGLCQSRNWRGDMKRNRKKENE